MTLPNGTDEMSKGTFMIKGLKLMTDKKGANNVIEATFQGDIIETITSKIAKVQDYSISLVANPDKKAYAGESTLVNFSLEEAVADSMIKERELDITFNGGVNLALNSKDKVEVSLNNETKFYDPIYKEEKVIGFSVPSIDNELLKQNLAVKVNTSLVESEGQVNVTVAGRALGDKELTQPVLQVKKPVDVAIDPIALEVFMKIGDVNLEVKTTAVFTINKNIYSVNNQAKTMDVKPYNKYGRTMLPVKYVAYALGLDESQVEWDNEKKIVTIHGEQIVQLTLWSKEMFINGVPTTMSAPATLDQGRTFIPVAEVARALNVDVSWDNETKSATFRAYKYIVLEIVSQYYVLEIRGDPTSARIDYGEG